MPYYVCQLKIRASETFKKHFFWGGLCCCFLKLRFQWRNISSVYKIALEKYTEYRKFCFDQSDFQITFQSFLKKQTKQTPKPYRIPIILWIFRSLCLFSFQIATSEELRTPRTGKRQLFNECQLLLLLLSNIWGKKRETYHIRPMYSISTYLSEVTDLLS